MSVNSGIRILDLGDAHLSEKKNVGNGEKGDGIDQHIVSEVVESNVHGRSCPRVADREADN